jgi:hypothetical protein
MLDPATGRTNATAIVALPARLSPLRPAVPAAD